MHTTSPADPDSLATLIAQHRDQPGALLPLLHAVQDALGHVPDDAVPAIARALNLSRAEVHGVITYYHFFRREAPGRQVVQVCRAEACRPAAAKNCWRWPSGCSAATATAPAPMVR